MTKNDVIVNIDTADIVYRGQTDVPLTINLSSPTTTNTNFPTYKIYVDDIEVTKSIYNTFNMPLNLPDKPQYVLRIVSNGTNIFNAFDTENKFVLENKNIEQITVGNTDDYQNATTLAKALELVDDYGVIVINKDIENEHCINDKNITIIGNGRTFVNCSIENQSALTVKDIKFTRSNADTDQYSAIVNNDELYVDNCTFMNQYAQYGAAIYIDSKNKNTKITNCQFTNNNASLYGGAIFSNKGNDVIIQSCTFGVSNCANSHGSSISVNGNMYRKDNTFYGNQGNDEIFVMNGTLEAEDNYFEGNIVNINNLNGNVSANLNYWGYNNIENVQNTWIGNVIIDNWLISDYTVHWTEPVLGNPQQHIVGTINKLKSRIKDEITLYKNIRGKIRIDGEYYNLDTEQITVINEFYIGQEHFNSN